MKVFLGCLLSALLIVVFNPLHAQIKLSSIHGKILSDNNSAVEAATIVLLRSRDSAIVKSAISGKDGLFVISGVYEGSYLTLSTSVGYNKTYFGPFQVSQGKDLNIGQIVLQISNTELKGVNISGKRDYVEVKTDKTILNVDRNILAAGNSVFDVLKTAPGVRVVNDEVLYKGGQKPLIAINGKVVNMTGEQLVALLKSYQSSMVSQIELIENPSARYDAANGGGMINIILKKNKDLGSNGSITESAAYGQKYKFNTGINWSLKTKKMNIYTSYSFVDNKLDHSIYTNRNIFNNSHNYNLIVNYNAATISRNHNFNFGADYAIGPKQTIGFVINGYVNNSEIDKHNITNVFTDRQLDSNIVTKSIKNNKISSLNYNLNYRAILGNAGKSTLSADLDYSDYNRHSTEQLESDFYNETGQINGFPVFYLNSSPSLIKIRAEKVDFSQVISKSSSFDIGIKNSQVNSDNLIDFQKRARFGAMSIPALTDHFIYKERINTAYASYNARFNKTSLTLGLRAEQTNSNAQSVSMAKLVPANYLNLFPNVQLSQRLNKDNQLSLFYNRSIERPNYQDLNPFVGYVDQYYYSTGNPFLKPQYFSTYQISDIYLNQYKASFSVIVTDDFYDTIFQQDNATKVYVTTKSNLGLRYQYMTQLSFPVNITNWWKANVNMKASYERYVYKISNSPIKTTWDVDARLVQNFIITKKLNAQINTYYETATFYAISQYKPYYDLSAALSYAVMANKGSIKIGVTDILNSDINKYHSNYLNLNISERAKFGTRFIMATFIYRFGNLSVKSLFKNTGNSEEQKRLSGSTNDN